MKAKNIVNNTLATEWIPLLSSFSGLGSPGFSVDDAVDLSSGFFVGGSGGGSVNL